MQLLLSGNKNSKFCRRAPGQVTGRRDRELIRGAADPTAFPGWFGH